MLLYTLALFTVGYLFYLALEKLLNERRIKSFDLRVLINGTRGKSGVVKYIHAGLSPTPVVGKITGVIPTIIKTDGTLLPVKRRGKARIQEQVRTVRYAERQKAWGIVLECMSVSPDLQVLEGKILKPHIYVITNIRSDHAEVMGATPEEQAESVCRSIPPKSIVVTAEKVFLDKIISFAKEKGSRVITVTENDIPELPEVFIPENVSIAVKVCELAGFDRDTAIQNILERCSPSIEKPVKLGNNITFINGFAVNDVPSADIFIRKQRMLFPDYTGLVVIFNSRNDRPIRSVEFARYFCSENRPDKIILTGNHNPRVKRELVKSGYDEKNIITWRKKDKKNIKENLLRMCENKTIVVGIGNIAGSGFKITEVLGAESLA